MTGRYSKVELTQHITQVDQRTYDRDYDANVSYLDERSTFLDDFPITILSIISSHMQYFTRKIFSSNYLPNAK